MPVAIERPGDSETNDTQFMIAEMWIAAEFVSRQNRCQIAGPDFLPMPLRLLLRMQSNMYSFQLELQLRSFWQPFTAVGLLQCFLSPWEKTRRSVAPTSRWYAPQPSS